MAALLLEPTHFRAHVAQEIARARRSGGRFSVALFTIVPDYGEHPELACVAALPSLLSDVRETDSVCRVADDCIAVLFIDTDGGGSDRAAQRLLAGLRLHAIRWDIEIVEYPQDAPLISELVVLAA